MLTVALLVCALALTRVNADDPVVLEPDQHDGHDHSNATRSHVAIPAILTPAARGTCPAGWQPYEDHCFNHVTEKKNWAGAQSQCQMMGGNLASIHDVNEHTFVQTITTNPVWIGGSDCQVATNWFWVDGKPFDFNFWCGAQPDNTLDQCCTMMNHGESHCWDDQPCTGLHEFICERQM